MVAAKQIAMIWAITFTIAMLLMGYIMCKDYQDARNRAITEPQKDGE